MVDSGLMVEHSLAGLVHLLGEYNNLEKEVSDGTFRYVLYWIAKR